MAASRVKTYRVRHNLADAIELRAQQCGYPSGNAYLVGLAQYDCLCQAGHNVTKTWVDSLSPEEMDILEAALLRRVQERKGMKAKQAATLDWRTL